MHIRSSTQPSSAGDDTRCGKLVKLYVYFVFMFQSIFRISDNCVAVLLLFFATFLGTLTRQLQLEGLEQFVTKLPRTINSAKMIAGCLSQPFKKYACCQLCHTLYPLDKCTCTIVLPDNSITSRLCDHVEYPNHPQPQHRKPCGTPLMKRVQLSSGNVQLMPHKVFCYTRVSLSLCKK